MCASLAAWRIWSDWCSSLNFVETNTKIGSGLYDNNRAHINSEYLGLLERDGLAIIAGGDYRGTSIETEYNGNPHNSYIRAHNIFGLPYLFVMLLFPLLLSRGQRFGDRVYGLILIAVMLFRAATEPILFPSLFDLFFFGSCFMLGLKKPMRT